MFFSGFLGREIYSNYIFIRYRNVVVMGYLFNVLKWFFFVITVVVAVIYMRGASLFDEATFLSIKLIMIPGYLFFCGLMIGKLIMTLRSGNPAYQDASQKEGVELKWFLFGIVLGSVLSLLYVFE